MECPKCGAELKSVGHPKDGFQRYVCPNGCKPTLIWQIKEGLNIALYIMASVIFAIYIVVVAFLVYIYRKVYRKVKG